VLGDSKEGIKAFLEKRNPNYQNKASQMPRVLSVVEVGTLL
jgi:1,4-dihydroxy-2-naphthoyl-CoA synthase